MLRLRIRHFSLCVIFFIFICFDAQGEVVQDIYEQEIIDTLHMQASKKHLQAVRDILQMYPMHINSVDNNGRSLLHNAVLKSDIEMVEFLLSKRADVNFQHIQSEGNTALHYSKLPEITQKLIDHGALLDILNMHRNSPLLVHIRHTGLTTENIHVLLEAGARTDIVSYKKFTALHFLFATNVEYTILSSDPLERQKFNKVWLQLAEDLIDHGVDVNASNEHGFTALHYAARKGYVEGIEFLFDHGGKDRCCGFQ